MSSNPVPQSVNVSHALPATVIQQMRTNIDEYQNKLPLTEQEQGKLTSYISDLNKALKEFTNDNKHVQPGGQGVTNIDIELVNGLVSLYHDYLNKFLSIQKNIDSNPVVEGSVKPKTQKAKSDSPNLNLDKGVQALKNQATENVQEMEIPTDQSEPQNEQSGEENHNSQQVEEPPAEPKMKVEKPKRKKVPKKEIYIADLSKKREQSPSDSNETEEVAEPEQPSQKKISFTKYLKKDETVAESKKRQLVDDDSSEANSTISSDSTAVKRMKIDNSEVKIRSILKNSELNSLQTASDAIDGKIKKKVGITFPGETDLVRVYGEDLPDDGLKVTPNELKKLLRPFKEGEPHEKVLLEDFVPKPQKLIIDTNVENSDISELFGGPVKCETQTPVLYRDNFKNFSKDLMKPPREPIPEMNNSRDTSKPLVVKAYGRNSLLLRNDRGGLPYKRVPEVRRNAYPVRYQK